MATDAFKRQPEERRHHPVLFETQLSEPHVSSPHRWYMGDHLQYYPTNDALCGPDGIDFVLRGWRPEQPLITPATRVLAMGSCFAASFLDWLEERGFGQNSTFLPYTSMFESVAVIEQQLRWAFGEMDPRHALWIDRNGAPVEATEERRLALREALVDCDVLILTLGMSEGWFDRVTNEPLWRALPVDSYDPGRHEFRVLSSLETRRYLESIVELQARFFPSTRILFTVSPVALNATFRPISSVTANAVSKATVRSGLDEFFRANPAGLGKQYFYYPSYELVMDVYRRPFAEDNRHPEDLATAHVLAIFASTYTSLEASSALSSLPDLREAISSDAQRRALRFEIASSEKEREIRNLAAALEERLAVIEQLDAEVKRLRGLLGK